MNEPNRTIEAIFRSEAGRIIATLIRVSQSFDLAEEALQDAFASALVDWTAKGPSRESWRLDYRSSAKKADRLQPQK